MDKITSKEVLKIVGVSSIIVSSFVAPGLPSALTKTIKGWKYFNKDHLGKIVKRLNKQELISIREENNQTILKITEKGKLRILQYKFNEIALNRKKSDQKIRLISFDIPERKKKNRDLFVKKLKELGMIKWQESSWVSAYPCKKEIDFLCNYLEISDYVTLLSIDKIERGGQLIFKSTKILI